jgi:RND family efflux transporter MFP subunit
MSTTASSPPPARAASTPAATPAADVSAIAGILGDQTPAAAPARRRGWFPWRLFIACGVLGGLAAATPWALARMGGGMGAADDGLLTHPVERGNLRIAVTEDGSLVSDENVDIVCGVAGGATIVWLIDDGAQVTEGTELVKLDSSALSESVTAQKIAYEKARAACIQAEKDYAAAKIAVEEYTEGTYKKDLRKAESDVTAAKERLQATENGLAHGEKMFRKGYIAPQQLDAQKSALERAKLDLGTAEIALDVLERFAKPKMITELASKRDAMEAKRDSEQAALQLEKAKLERLSGQLEKCVLKAPKDGLVIYANERTRDAQSEIKNGAKVNEGTTILRLPNLSRMRADVEVHESKDDRNKQGMKSRIRVQGRGFDGTVTTVANRPQSNWMSTVKKYVVQVKIDGASGDLRPGLTAEVEIIVAELDDVIAVPVAAVAEQGGKYFCGLRSGDTVVRREVTLGQGNDKLVEVAAGLEPGDVVVLNPRAALGEPAEGQAPGGGRPEGPVAGRRGGGAQGAGGPQGAAPAGGSPQGAARQGDSGRGAAPAAAPQATGG